MAWSVAIAGASGMAAGEMLRMIARHPHLELGTVTAASSVGTRLGDHHPHIPVFADREIVSTTSQHLAGHDVVVFALPHGASASIADTIDSDAILVDLGADHRLVSSAAWHEYYGTEHAGTWTYGMPELLHAGETVACAQRELLRGTRRIAVPGCNVTAVTFALQAGIGAISGQDLVAVLANGYSGAGRTLKPHLMAVAAFGNVTPYQVGGLHRHIPEIIQNLQVAGLPDASISFTPTLVPMSRGILATVTARLGSGIDPAALRDKWLHCYRQEPFVTVLPAESWPQVSAVAGGNGVHMNLAWDAKVGRVVIVVALDNLVKGTAGGAIQSLNLALGLAETCGLSTEGCG